MGNGLGRVDKILIYNPPTSRDHPADTLRLQSVTGGHLASAQILLSHGAVVVHTAHSQVALEKRSDDCRTGVCER